MGNEIFSLWYKQPAMLTSFPEMALMIKKEGVEGYGLYMIFADSLHVSGGYRENNFDDISLVLDCSKKKIKMKLKYQPTFVTDRVAKGTMVNIV